HQPADPLRRTHRRHADLPRHERLPDGDPGPRHQPLRRGGGAHAARLAGASGPGSLRRADRGGRRDAARLRPGAGTGARTSHRSRGPRPAAGPRRRDRAAPRQPAARRLQERHPRGPRARCPPDIMKFHRTALSIPHLWSSPFVRWQGSLADVTSLDLAAAVTGDALAARGVDRPAIDTLVLGSTIPQLASFYATPWLAARLELPGISGPHIAQACATSVACLVAAAMQVECDPD